MSAPQRYVALLRGINVGGNNVIKMIELKACFEKCGFKSVRTYIQSGNVIFESPEKDVAKLTGEIEAALSKAFSYKSVVLVRSRQQIKETVQEAPKGFGQDAALKYDVVFIRQPATAAQAMQAINPRQGVDTAVVGNGVLYFTRVAAEAVRSRFPRLASTPMYQHMTIRNWNTTIKLLHMMEEA